MEMGSKNTTKQLSFLTCFDHEMSFVSYVNDFEIMISSECQLRFFYCDYA